MYIDFFCVNILVFFVINSFYWLYMRDLLRKHPNRWLEFGYQYMLVTYPFGLVMMMSIFGYVTI